MARKSRSERKADRPVSANPRGIRIEHACEFILSKGPGAFTGFRHAVRAKMDALKIEPKKGCATAIKKAVKKSGPAFAPSGNAQGIYRWIQGAVKEDEQELQILADLFS